MREQFGEKFAANSNEDQKKSSLQFDEIFDRQLTFFNCDVLTFAGQSFYN